ncbi:aminotransferase class I/II-fold pyridoxal phosphate-dependent enzyme [Natranaerofaba carboxydovora]|uniref:aminotransferase class I/II-fold pyridoxal phosphate-dependent enzyme n=1 Tax=Natranaerofaba carboxydovora TaxID=2742683 RepID=UPI001F12A263|nr:aminotransferase class I/II-fold pyridoxal phosphate-dependent enzyme [Natranaerofaba carboxydovora]UMZ75236.1 Arginine decarboxylase [Natranaerofaba carboxydovora]
MKFRKERRETPIYEALKKYINKEYLNFHTPGHCQGKWVEEKLKKVIGEKVFKADLTELPGLDNLNNPVSSIKESERLAAETFGADNTKFLVNGSTAGIMAAIMTAASQDEKILIPRNAHKSVYNALILSGADPSYLPLKKTNGNFPLNVDIEVLKNKLKENIFKALLLTNPSYYGVCINNINEIKCNPTHNDILMIIDEAHGAHLDFCNKLSDGASKSGADLWVQSIHKNLGSLTQSAMLHFREDKIDSQRLEAMLSLLQTTSPSYLLLLSLELARYNLEIKSNLWDDFIERLIRYRQKIIEEIKGFELLQKNDLDPSFNLDITKLTLFTNKLGVTGYEIAKILREDYNILVEISSYDHILLFLTPAHDEEDLGFVLNALDDLSKRLLNFNKPLQQNYKKIPDIPDIAFKPGDAIKLKNREVNLEEACGKISADFVVPYPPGIPVLIPGEIITKDIINYIEFINFIEGTIIEGVIKSNNKRKGIKVVENY